MVGTVKVQKIKPQIYIIAKYSQVVLVLMLLFFKPQKGSNTPEKRFAYLSTDTGVSR